MKTRNGFTLIELLMVVAIISLISSILFYNVSEAKKKGEDAHMKAESAEVAKAVYQYKEDNGGKAPGALSVATGRVYLEGSDEYNQALGALVPNYISEIPSSPSGEGYAYMISEDGTEAVFIANLNREYETNGNNTCRNSGNPGNSGNNGGNSGDPCPYPEFPPEYYDLYEPLEDYVNGGYYSYPKAIVPNVPGRCDLNYNYDYGHLTMAGYISYGEYQCIDLPDGLAQAQEICDLYQSISGQNTCAGVSGPYYNDVNGVLLYRNIDVTRSNEYLSQYMQPWEDAEAEYSSCMDEHADEYDEYGDWIGGGNAQTDENVIEQDYCTYI